MNNGTGNFLDTMEQFDNTLTQVSQAVDKVKTIVPGKKQQQQQQPQPQPQQEKIIIRPVPAKPYTVPWYKNPFYLISGFIGLAGLTGLGIALTKLRNRRK